MRRGARIGGCGDGTGELHSGTSKAGTSKTRTDHIELGYSGEVQWVFFTTYDTMDGMLTLQRQSNKQIVMEENLWYCLSS